MRHAIQEAHRHSDYPELSIQLRSKSRFYQALVFHDGRKVQHCLKTDQLTTALKLGQEWYRKLLRGSERARRLDRLSADPTVAEVVASYRQTLPPSKRAYADMKWSGGLADFWRTLLVNEVTPKTFREFYTWRRRRKTRTKTVIKNHSLHKDMMVIRQVLKYAIEEGHIGQLPIIPNVGKIPQNPRPWLTGRNGTGSLGARWTAWTRRLAIRNCSNSERMSTTSFCSLSSRA